MAKIKETDQTKFGKNVEKLLVGVKTVQPLWKSWAVPLIVTYTHLRYYQAMKYDKNMVNFK